MELTKVLLWQMAFRDGSLGSSFLMVNLWTPNCRILLPYKLIFSTVLLLHLTISFAICWIIYWPQVDLNPASSGRFRAPATTLRFGDVFGHGDLGWSARVKLFVEASRFLAFFETEKAFGVGRFRGASFTLIDVSVEAVLRVVEILHLPQVGASSLVLSLCWMGIMIIALVVNWVKISHSIAIENWISLFWLETVLEAYSMRKGVLVVTISESISCLMTDEREKDCVWTYLLLVSDTDAWKRPMQSTCNRPAFGPFSAYGQLTRPVRLWPSFQPVSHWPLNRPRANLRYFNSQAACAPWKLLWRRISRWRIFALRRCWDGYARSLRVAQLDDFHCSGSH